jgi:hypothetical protein
MKIARLGRIVTLIVATFSVALIGWAQGASLELVAHLGGRSLAIGVDGDLVCLSEGPRLVTLDVSDPLNPVRLGQSDPLPSRIVDLQIEGEFAYAADVLHGLQVLSLQDPTRPVVVGSVTTHDSAEGVCVHDGLAFVADRYDGLTVVSIADPTAPELVGSIDTPGSAQDVAVFGKIAYVADREGGLRVVSVADPTAPVELGSIESFTYAISLEIDDALLYLVDREGGLFILSIEDPTTPVIVGQYEAPYPDHVLFSEGHLVLATSQPKLLVLSVEDPANPTLVTEVLLPAVPRSLAKEGDRLFVAVGTAGLCVLDLASPASPEVIGAYDRSFYGSNLVVQGETVYVSDLYEGLHILSIEDRTQPTHRHTVELLDPRGLAIADSRLYVTTRDGLSILDLSDPIIPFVRSTVPLSGMIANVIVQGDFAYVSAGSDGLHVVSIADPDAPQRVHTIPFDGYVLPIAVDQEHLYVGASGLHTFSITDPARPRLVCSNPTERQAVSMAIQGDRLLFGESSDLSIYSLADPASPVELGIRRLGLKPRFDVVGDYALVGLEWVGVRIMDFSDPSSIQILDTFDTADRAVAVVIVGDYVHVADQEGGYYLLRMVLE